MMTLLLVLGLGYNIDLCGSSFTHFKNDRLGYMESQANSKAKIRIFTSVMDSPWIFTVLLLLTKTYSVFNCMGRKFPQIGGLHKIEAIFLYHKK